MTRFRAMWDGHTARGRRESVGARHIKRQERVSRAQKSQRTKGRKGRGRIKIKQ